MSIPSLERRRAAVVPWLAAMVLAASAHLGWWIHELDGPDGPTSVSRVELDVDARTVVILAPPVRPATAAGIVTVDCRALAELEPDQAARALDFTALDVAGGRASGRAGALGAELEALCAAPTPEPSGSRSIAVGIAYEHSARSARRAHERL